MEPITTEILLTYDEVAEALRITKRNLAKKVHRDQVAVVEYGGTKRIPLSSLPEIAQPIARAIVARNNFQIA